MAAVMAHELGHLTLGHYGELVNDMEEQVGDSWTKVTAGDCSNYECELTYDVTVIEETSNSRENEFAADAAGSLYLLRAGWEIQDMMDLTRQLDRTLREGGNYYSVQAATYVSSHPRPSEREAALEELRGQLKRDQTYFDDALTLVRNNIELDRAVALLDGVLDHFPGLHQARHARGVAYHRMFLNRVSIQDQQVRASMPTYDAYFLPGIRSAIDSSTMEIADRARSDYEAVLESEYLPYTLSNLATLMAYYGDYDLALRVAQFADSVKPGDPQILNNLGVVEFYGAFDESAQGTFSYALEVADRQDSVSILFNLGKTQWVLDDPAADQTLRAYLELDRASQWRQDACEMIGMECAPAAADNSGLGVTVAGVRLGGDLNSAIAALGEPERTSEIAGAEWLHYDLRGISLLAVPEKGITFIQLDKPEAGSIEGLRVGDPFADVYAKLGVPVHVDGSWQVFKVGRREVRAALESIDGVSRIKHIATSDSRSDDPTDDTEVGTGPDVVDDTEVGTGGDVVVALYTAATWYAGRTDYTFETEDGQRITVGVSNFEDGEPRPQVPDNMLEPESRGPPGANPALVDQWFEIAFDADGRVVSITLVRD
jgi:tetratricopeptide (TPR) repeat protein